MKFLNKIREKIQNVDEKDFYKYLFIFFSVFVLIILGLILFYYLKINSLKESIEDINQMRETDVRNILMRSEKVRKQRQEVNNLLAKDPGFKILGYYQSLLRELDLTKYFKIATPRPKKLNDTYRESELIAELAGMNMEQLCRLLQALEDNARITVKSLLIKKSQKTSRAIDVSLTIATLQPVKEKTT